LISRMGLFLMTEYRLALRKAVAAPAVRSAGARLSYFHS
jgi:hypothetical protein